MADDFKYDVFLSHSSKDKVVVRPVAERLRADKLRVWFDEWEISIGDSIPAKIEEGLEHSRILILCMSAHAFGSDWATLESQTFRFRDPLNQERRFIPLRLDTAPIKGSLAQFLYINWLSEDREQAYTKLLEACRKGEGLVTTDTSALGDGWSAPAPQDVVIDRTSRDDFSSKTKDTLARRVGMLCSNPACRKLTSGPQFDPTKALNIGVAAHITAASVGGPRYDQSKAKDERSSIENGIWLCQNCAKLVDNDEHRYTVQMLYAWKKQAEDEALRHIETNKMSALLGQNSANTYSHLEYQSESKLARLDIAGPSPFQIVGAMELEVKSYVPRNCDGELKRAAESHTFIWLQGGFQFGKTSLLNRHGSWLGADWAAVYVDLQGCERSTDAKFRRHFFTEIEEVLGTKCDWQALKTPLRQRRIAFLLDEFGACKPTQILEMLEHFHSLAEKAPGHLKLVVSVRENPTPYLPKCGIQNPKHIHTWKIIRLETLTPGEVGQLIALFPITLSALLHNRLDRIHSITNSEPQRVQYLFNKLWDVFRSPQENCEVTQSFIDKWLDSEEAQ
jgi:hypothetical protein